MTDRHRLADRSSIDFDDLVEEPFLALPESAGPLRDYWLAADHRHGRAPIIGAEITSADETYEAFSNAPHKRQAADPNVLVRNLCIRYAKRRGRRRYGVAGEFENRAAIGLQTRRDRWSRCRAYALHRAAALLNAGGSMIKAREICPARLRDRAPESVASLDLGSRGTLEHGTFESGEAFRDSDSTSLFLGTQPIERPDADQRRDGKVRLLGGALQPSVLGRRQPYRDHGGPSQVGSAGPDALWQRVGSLVVLGRCALLGQHLVDLFAHGQSSLP